MSFKIVLGKANVWRENRDQWPPFSFSNLYITMVPNKTLFSRELLETFYGYAAPNPILSKFAFSIEDAFKKK